MPCRVGLLTCWVAEVLRAELEERVCVAFATQNNGVCYDTLAKPGPRYGDPNGWYGAIISGQCVLAAAAASTHCPEMMAPYQPLGSPYLGPGLASVS